MLSGAVAPLGSWYRRRRQADVDRHPGRDSLLAYCRHVDQHYRTPPHIVELAEVLESVERGDRDRVIITIPVRHGKSLLAQYFIGWWMGRNPRSQIIHASHKVSLVEDFGGAARNTLLGEFHADVFPGSTLAPDARAANRWRTTEGGVYIATGAGGAIAGRGADLLVVDDATAGREAADSETQSAKVWAWWRADIRTRLLPGARIVIIGSRWSTDDLIGRILEDRPDRWFVHHRPAIDDDGVALWPEQYSVETLNDIREDVSPREWQAQFQGDPTPVGGPFFKEDWFRLGDPPPVEHMRIYATSDLATKHNEGDWSVHAIWGLDPQNRLWLLDMWRKQETSNVWVEAWADLAERYKPVLWCGERGQIHGTVEPFLLREFRRRGLHQRIELLTSAADKPTRARAMQGWMERYGLWLPKGVVWAGKVINEFLKFPAMTSPDDIVDTGSLMGRMMEMMRAGKVPPPPPQEFVVDTRRPTMDEVWAEQDRRRRR